MNDNKVVHAVHNSLTLKTKVSRNCLPFRSTWAHPCFFIGVSFAPSL